MTLLVLLAGLAVIAAAVVAVLRKIDVRLVLIPAALALGLLTGFRNAADVGRDHGGGAALGLLARRRPAQPRRPGVADGRHGTQRGAHSLRAARTAAVALGGRRRHGGLLGAQPARRGRQPARRREGRAGR